MNSQDLIVGKSYSIRKPAHWSRSKQKPVVGKCIANGDTITFEIGDMKRTFTQFIFSKLEVTLLPDKPAPKPKKPKQNEMCLATTTSAQRKRHAKLLKAK